MPIQTDDELERQISLRHDAHAYIPALEAALLNFEGNKGILAEIIELMRLYKPDDPITPKPGASFERLHFYILNIEQGGMISHSEFFYDFKQPLDDDKALDRIDKWIDGDFSSDRVSDSNLDELKWSGRSILAFAINANVAGWSFFESKKRSAIQFPDARISGGTEYYPNKTFYDSRFKTSKGGTRVLLVNNHHMLPDGQTARRRAVQQDPNTAPPPDDYKFDLYIRAKVKKPGGIDILTLVLDPGGKNLGP